MDINREELAKSLETIGRAFKSKLVLIQTETSDALVGLPSCVYFVQCTNGGAIKIGVASDLARRLRDLQAMNPYDLVIIGAIPGGGYKLERQLHKKFEKFHIHHEWFQPDEELLQFIANLEDE